MTFRQSQSVRFLELSEGRVAVGCDGFSAVAPAPGKAAFYEPDFLLKTPCPWWIPAHFEILSRADFFKIFAPSLSSRPALKWAPLRLGPYAEHFRRGQEAMRAGQIEKWVPIVFEHAQLTSSHDLFSNYFSYLMQHASKLPNSLRVYGSFDGHQGRLGASPEILLEQNDNQLQTYAVAGTRPRGREQELLTDSKEQREHSLVVTDIVDRVKGLVSEISVGECKLQRLPTLAHLKTEITLQANSVNVGSAETLFCELVQRLHPTAALGGFPRNYWLSQILNDEALETKRGRFGAPFAFVSPQGHNTAVVAIRNLEWSDSQIRIGSGSGVLAQSRLESEWHELSHKRLSVKRMFGLAVD